MNKLGLLVGAEKCELSLGRRASLMALLLGVLVVLGVGVAGAAPIGQITEFTAPGSNPAQVVAGSDRSCAACSPRITDGRSP
jgi:hypothetical protein